MRRVPERRGKGRFWKIRLSHKKGKMSRGSSYRWQETPVTRKLKSSRKFGKRRTSSYLQTVSRYPAREERNNINLGKTTLEKGVSEKGPSYGGLTGSTLDPANMKKTMGKRKNSRTRIVESDGTKKKGTLGQTGIKSLSSLTLLLRIPMPARFTPAERRIGSRGGGGLR